VKELSVGVHTDGLLKIAVGGKVKVFWWVRLGSM
jgi:hypothetical protein